MRTSYRLCLHQRSTAWRYRCERESSRRWLLPHRERRTARSSSSSSSSSSSCLNKELSQLGRSPQEALRGLPLQQSSLQQALTR